MNLTLSIRRTLVVVSVLLYALIFVPALTSFWFIGLVVLLQGVLFAFVGRQGKHIYTDANENLDERQLSLWQGAHHRAYRILVGLLGVALVYVIVLGSTLGLPDTRLEWTVTVLALWMFAMILPSSLIYWSEPDILYDAPEVG